jgi:hypothetical protein
VREQDMFGRFLTVLLLLILQACGCFSATENDDGAECGYLFHLKFFKVGSGSTNVVLRTAYGGEKWTKTWFTCDDPYGHGMLTHYQENGLGDAFKAKCFLNTSQSCDFKTLAVFRDPVEKMVSQWYAFRSDMLQAIETFNLKAIEPIAQKLFLNNASAISKNEMVQFIATLSKKKNVFVRSLMPLEYEPVLSMSPFPFKSSAETLTRALSNLAQLTFVGTTESLNSLFVLISIVRNIPLEQFCGVHVHDSQKKNSLLFNTTVRPSPVELFQPDVFDYLTTLAENETKIWNRAKELHIDQLKKYNLSLTESLDLWDITCSGKNSDKKKKGKNMPDKKKQPKKLAHPENATFTRSDQKNIIK